jgi:hypothetical protein
MEPGTVTISGSVSPSVAFQWNEVNPCSLPAINLINILRTAFAPIFLRHTDKREKPLNALLLEKVELKCWWNWHLLFVKDFKIGILV